MSTNTAFIVTTSIAGTSKTQVWNPELPLALGHPLRWIAERTRTGVRIRSLATPVGRVSSVAGDSLCEISEARLQKGTEIHLPHAAGVSLKIRPVASQAPAYGGRQGDQLSIYACKGAGNQAWVTGTQLLGGAGRDRYAARARDAATGTEREVFTARTAGGTLHIHAAVDGLTLRRGGEAPRALATGQATEILAARIADAVLVLGTDSWRFGKSVTVAMPERKKLVLDDESAWFQKALRYAAVGFGAFMVLTWVWPAPKPNTQELIPAQFAKIILSKPPTAAKVKASASEGNPTQAKQAAVPEKVAKAAVVQAFRAKALSNAVSGLLKGGMTSLLAQSDLVAGKSADARRSFDSRSTALEPTTGAQGVSSNTNRQVASIGGSGEGQGAGYGKGEHAGVKGQGQAFVSMDVAGAAVDEGLTKDEVGEVIHRHLSEVRYCYESAMIRTADLEGKLMTNFTIGGNGVVKSTEVKSSTLPDPRLDDCILRRLATWKFPNPRGGIDVAVSYPFIFKSLGR